MGVFRRLAWFFRRHAWRYAVGIAVLVIIDVLMLWPPRLVGVTVDRMRTGTLTDAELMQVVWLLIGLGLVLYGLRYAWRHLLFGGSLLLERELRSRLFTHLTTLTPSFFHRRRTGDLMAAATNDIPAVEMTAGMGVLTLIDSLFMTLLALGAMVLTVDWTLTLAALLPMPFLAWSTAYYGKRLHERFYQAQEAFGRMNDHVQEAVSGVRVLRGFVQEAGDAAAFRRVSEETLQRNLAVARIDALFEPTITLIIGSSFFIGLGYGIWLVFGGHISLGDLVAFHLYLGLLIWPMFAFGWLMNILQRGSASLKRLEELFAEKPDVTDTAEQNGSRAADDPAGPERSGAAKPAVLPLSGGVEARHLTFAYPGAERPALADVCFRLERGDTLGVVGPTGSGKSTLCRLLLRQYPVELNRLFLFGRPIEQHSLSALRAATAYVPQEHLLFSRTIRENVAFAKPQATDEEVRRALRLAGLLDEVDQFPDGWETRIGEKGVMLSGGQKQRLSLARALLRDAELLILDDALSAVDARTEEEILRHLRQERAGRTTIITAHRLSAVQHAHLILVLMDGIVAEAGTHEELLARGGWYREQYRRQQLEGLARSMAEGEGWQA